MLPIQFLNQIFLVGLAAAALPILIHLFSKRRAREVHYPSLEFLKEVSKKKVRRLQLRQLLLLALRVLIIGLFALAIARPAMRAGGGALGRGSTTLAVILDNSFSMAARDPHASGPPGGEESTLSPGGAWLSEEGTVFASAKRRALEVVSLMREGDRGVVGLAAQPVRFPYMTGVADPGLLRQEIERSAIGATRADLRQAVSQALALLAEAKTINRELFIVSDFQRSDLEAWQAESRQSGDSATVKIPEALSRAAMAGPRVYLIPARRLSIDNLAIERLRLDPLGAGPEGGARLIVTVSNESEKEARDVVLRALSDGENPEALGEAYVTVPPMGRTETSVLLRRLPSTGGLRVALAPDPLPADNQAFLVTEQPGVRTVLVVSGAPNPEEDPAARYVSLALDPSGTHEFFSVEAISADASGLAAAIRADAVILLDLGRLPEAALGQIERFRAEGGGLLIVLGERTDPRMYNSTLSRNLADIELLGSRGETEGPDAYRSLRVAATGHPIFDGFGTAAGENLSAAKFRRILEGRPGPEARVLAEFSGGLPALIEDRGTLVFTSSLDGRWNDLPTSGAFLPLLHRMMQYLIAHGGGRDRLLAGEMIEHAVDIDRLGAQEALMIDPQGARSAMERSEREGRIWLKGPPTRSPGIYEIARTDGARLGLFAVNLDARESDLRVAPEAWLRDLFEPPAAILAPDGEITRDLLEERHGRELWPILLMMVLGLLAVESLVGRGKILP